jgi:hypothetical protein
MPGVLRTLKGLATGISILLSFIIGLLIVVIAS